jgi:hypothetical protein
MTNDSVYVAIITTKVYFEESSWNDVVAFFNKKYPQNGLIIEKYFVDLSPAQTIIAIKDFIGKYPTGKRAVITNYSIITIESSNYCKDNNIDILHVSAGANSNLIKTLYNTITYSPYNQYSVMSFFQVFVDYQMNQIKILYDQNNKNSPFYKTILDEIVKQADLLKINYSISFLEEGVINYNIKKKSAIFILSDSEPLEQVYITPGFLKNIPDKCFIGLSENYYKDIFGNVPALVFCPFPINYTVTSQEVYNAINNKRIIDYTIFSIYDILFVLNNFSFNGISLNVVNYINSDVYSGSVVPAALYNNYIDKNINGAPYGRYQLLFTKNVIIDKDVDLFLKNYRGGQLSLPDSYSVFKNIGITPNNSSLIEYDEADYYKIYRNWKLFIVRFNINITEISLINNLNVGNTIKSKFIYEYTTDEYFKTLKRLIPMNNKDLPKVNAKMSKVPIKLHYFY